MKKPFRIVLANSGVTADTAKLDDYINLLKEKDPKLFAARKAEITSQAEEMKAALEAYDLEKVGAIMTANHSILIEMELSHEILVDLCQKAIKMGALGAKVTGGGRGGYMVALTPGKDLQQALAAAYKKEGYQVIQAQIGGS